MSEGKPSGADQSTSNGGGGGKDEDESHEEREGGDTGDLQQTGALRVVENGKYFSPTGFAVSCPLHLLGLFACNTSA